MRNQALIAGSLLFIYAAYARGEIQPTGADDTASIQAALDSGETQIGSGHFTVSSPIVIPESQTLTGAGMGKTVLEMTPTAPGETRSAVIMLRSNSSVENLTVTSTSANCNGIVADGGAWPGIDVHDASVSSCEVHHAATHVYGIWGHKAPSFAVDRCIVDGGCTTLDNSIGQEGIELFGCDGASVRNCLVSHCGRGGITLFGEAVSADNILIEACQASSCTFGILVTVNGDESAGITHVLIRKNIIDASGSADIAVTSGSQGVISCEFEKNLYSSQYVCGTGKQLVMVSR